jgi:hypothetical protein
MRVGMRLQNHGLFGDVVASSALVGATALVNFASLFLFARCLDTDSFGLFSTCRRVVAFVAPFVSLGAHLGVPRYVGFYAAEARRKCAVVALGILVTAVVVPVTALVHSTKGAITVASLLEQQVNGDDAVHLRQIESIKERHAILARFEATLKQLHDLLDGQQASVLGQREVAEPLALLRDFERLMLERYAKILERDHPELRAQDAAALAARARALDIDAVAAWREFRRARVQTTELLHSLGPKVWQRRAVHPHRGEISMNELVARHLDHDAEQVGRLRAFLHAARV